MWSIELCAFVDELPVTTHDMASPKPIWLSAIWRMFLQLEETSTQAVHERSLLISELPTLNVNKWNILSRCGLWW